MSNLQFVISFLETGIGESRLKRQNDNISTTHLPNLSLKNLIYTPAVKAILEYSRFTIIQLGTNDKDLSREYEDYCIKKLKIKLSNLLKETN